MRKQLESLRRRMEQQNIDACYIPTADYHSSEYVGEFFKTREYISGFTGSAGSVMVTMTQAILWTDGRYFIQAEKELQGSGFTLYPSGQEEFPDLFGYAENNLEDGCCLAFDGRTVDAKTGERLRNIIEKKHGRMLADVDLAGEIWEDRPKQSANPAWELPLSFCGESLDSKREWLTQEIQKAGCDYHVLNTLDDINWLLNIRGSDIPHFPVMYSYLIVDHGKIYLYAMDNAVAPVRNYLQEHGVEIRPYDTFYRYLDLIPPGASVLLDKNRINYRMLSLIHGNIVHRENPCVLRKAVKNPAELDHIREAHRKDGIAVCRFIFWLKNEIKKDGVTITEADAADQLEQFRRQQGILDISFDTISAYNENAAMMHYHASHENASVLRPEGLLLVDSGGHYMDGTTDITRTIVLGDIPAEWKLHYTTVCKSMLRLANAKFLHGCSGLSLDILSREPLWELGIDYRCGTGHGVGYLLNIHEPPNGFRYKSVPERNDGAVLEPGMVTTDEPGVYVEGSHGIRIENELICLESSKNEYGQFLRFENITYAPIDLDAIDIDFMTDTELEYLNTYHQLVYDVISPHLKEDEALWLKQATRKLKR